MKFKDLFQDVEEWFWKLEYNPELNSYELYLGIPTDWVYNEKSEGVTIELIHELELNSIIKISYTDEDLTVDDVIDTAKQLISKNRELEKRKESHRLEMENLKNILIEKEKNFLEYVDKVKDNSPDDGVSEGVNKGVNKGVTEIEKIAADTVNEAVIKATRQIAKKLMVDAPDLNVVDEKGKDFMEDIEKLKFK